MVAEFKNSENLSNNERRIDKQLALTHLEALGYKSGDNIYMRAFFPPDDPRSVEDKGRKADKLDFIEVESWQLEGRGIYFVVNGGGHKNKDVLLCRAIFMEHDNLDKELQRNLWQQLGLPEPTIQVDTGGKSIHSYWVFESLIPVSDWKQLQTDLLNFADGDRNIKNPSRVMRLAGAWHIKGDGSFNQSQIISNSGKRYSYKELRDIIPHIPQPTPGIKQLTTMNSEDVPLYQCLTKDDRALIDSGVGEGSRNSSGAKLARNLIGTAARLNYLGHRSSSDPRQLFDDYCNRCSPPLSALEADTIWRSAEKDNPTATLSDDALENCIKSWQRNLSKALGASKNRKSDHSTTLNEDACFNTWHAPESWKGEIGYWVELGEANHTGEEIKKRVFYPKCNFDFQVEKEFASVDGINTGGLVLQVKRSIDNVQQRVIISSLAYGNAKDFEESLKKVLGKGIVCNLKSEQIKSLIHVRLREYRHRGGLTYRLQDRAGQQSDGHWVFSDCQFTIDGEYTTADNYDWVYDPNLGGEDWMPAPRIAPPDPEALKRLVSSMHKFFGEDSIDPAILALGFVAAGTHYQTIIASDGRFPLMNLYGDAGTGKTVMAQCALSLVGWLNGDGIVSNVSESKLFEMLKLSGSLVQCWDDPTRTRDLDEILKKVYNSLPRVVRGNHQKPHAPLLLTANHVIGDSGQIATYTRVLQIPTYRSKDGDSDAWQELQESQKSASGCLSDLIKLGYPTKEIGELEKELRAYLPKAHPRMASSVALVTWYAMAVASLANFDSSRIKAYVIKQLCPSINAADSDTDSLTDFIDKLAALQSESLVGEWNCRVVESSDTRWLALQMTEIWSMVDKNFAPIYSRKALEAQIAQIGGKAQSVQKFHKNRDESLAYFRNLLSPRTDSEGISILPREPDYKPKRCVLIPIGALTSFNDHWFEPTPVTPVTPSYVQLQEKCNQQDDDTASVPGKSSTPVTSLKKEESFFLVDEEDFSDPWAEEETLESKKTDIFSQKNVTEPQKIAETTPQQSGQRLHEGSNFDVTQCNQQKKNVTEVNTALPPVGWWVMINNAIAQVKQHISDDVVHLDGETIFGSYRISSIVVLTKEEMIRRGLVWHAQ